MFTFNDEHFDFLHDLISWYIKENERNKKFGLNFFQTFFILLLTLTTTINDKPWQRPTGSSIDNQPLPPLDDPQNDWHSSICPRTQWKQKPTIKLLTAYGNQVEPCSTD
jgi:hypothetical protein